MNDVINKSLYAKLPFARKLTDEDKAVVSRLVKPANNGRTIGTNRRMDMPGMATASKIAMKTANNATDARNLFQVLPDMDLARSILISAILSPTDLTKRTLIYSLHDNQLDSNLTGPLLRLIKDRLEALIKINKLLPDMLDGALFGAGSYPIMVIPPSTIDNVINTTNKPNLESIADEVDREGWYRPYGVLGVPNEKGQYNSSMEMFNLDTGSLISQTVNKAKFQVSFENSTTSGVNGLSKLKGKVFVTDNPNVLKNPQLLDRIRKHRMGEIYGSRLKRAPKVSKSAAGTTGETVGFGVNISTEARTRKKGDDMSLTDVENMFYLNRQYSNTPLQPLFTAKQLGADNVGHPIVMHLPPEAVIPVHVPGNPRHHVGYFILLDHYGNPLSMSHRDDYYSDIRNNLAAGGDQAGQLLSMVRTSQAGGAVNGWQDTEIAEMTNAYAKIIEDDLLNRLRTGAATGDYQLSRTEDISRLMFSRALSEKNTLMLYVPVEMMTYIAFDYNEYGVGKSLLEDGKILGSIRAALLFAGTMAAIKNATGTQTIRINVPEEDEDPYGTVEFMLNEYAKVNGGAAFPIGITHPSDMISALQNAGKNIVVEGNTAFPETKFEVENREGSHKEMNTDLDEMMRRRHIQMFGLTPEIMDASTGVDFATTVVNQHLMLLKRVVQYQEEYTPFLGDLIRTYIINSGPMMQEMREFIEENKEHLPDDYKGKHDEFIFDLLNVLDVNLPAPDIDRMQDQMDRFNRYTEAVNAALDAYFKEEMFDQTRAMELFESIPSAKAVILGHFQRKWLRDNNILPELDIFNTVDEDDSPIFDLMEENNRHMDGILKSMEKYLEKANRAARARRIRLDAEKARMAAMEGGGEGDFGGGAITGFEEPTPDDGGGEPLPDADLDLDFPDEETPPAEEEETPPEEEETPPEGEEEDDTPPITP